MYRTSRLWPRNFIHLNQPQFVLRTFQTESSHQFGDCRTTDFFCPDFREVSLYLRRCDYLTETNTSDLLETLQTSHLKHKVKGHMHVNTLNPIPSTCPDTNKPEHLPVWTDHSPILFTRSQCWTCQSLVNALQRTLRPCTVRHELTRGTPF